MEPRFVERPGIMLVGIVGASSDVGKLDIVGLWERFDKQHKNIRHRVGEEFYEIHIQEETIPTMHFCLIGVEVEKIEDMPTELFAKVIPPCNYAIFTHQFKNGSFGEAFRAVYNWLGESSYVPAYPFDIQCYDERFKGADNPDSIFEIYVPIKTGE
jgi:AraC family transcriptional regulator